MFEIKPSKLFNSVERIPKTVSHLVPSFFESADAKSVDHKKLEETTSPGSRFTTADVVARSTRAHVIPDTIGDVLPSNHRTSQGRH